VKLVAVPGSIDVRVLGVDALTVESGMAIIEMCSMPVVIVPISLEVDRSSAQHPSLERVS
jgi:hypothetical protein